MGRCSPTTAHSLHWGEKRPSAVNPNVMTVCTSSAQRVCLYISKAPWPPTPPSVWLATSRNPAAPACRDRIGISPSSFPWPVAGTGGVVRPTSSPNHYHSATSPSLLPPLRFVACGIVSQTPTLADGLFSHPPITMRRPTPSPRKRGPRCSSHRPTSIAPLSTVPQPPDLRLLDVRLLADIGYILLMRSGRQALWTLDRCWF